jgi:hypothetical protein
MSAVEELRAAAKMLHETAAKATRGPWCCYPTVGRDHDLDEDNAYTVSKGYCGKEDSGGECEPDCGADVVHTGGMGCQEDTLKGDDAVWISLMHPGMAEPLATWLESVAAATERPVSPNRACVKSVACDTYGIDSTAALQVARVINGTAS